VHTASLLVPSQIDRFRGGVEFSLLFSFLCPYDKLKIGGVLGLVALNSLAMGYTVMIANVKWFVNLGHNFLVPKFEDIKSYTAKRLFAHFLMWILEFKHSHPYY
jgi:hypothetical protein